MDQVDAGLRQLAEELGLSLDRATLEGAMWALASLHLIARSIAERDIAEQDPPPSALAAVILRYIVVTRLEAMSDD